MDDIIITNTISEDKIHIDFNLQDGNLSFTTIELSTTGDIELNPLVIRLTELLELNRKIEIDYEDTNSLIESNTKIKLVIDALDEIYNSFNQNVIIEGNADVDSL